MTATISAVIITKNEEKNIERCLSSLQGIADEIIVVDSFSTDETAQICNKYNVHFVQKKFIDYSNAKNHGNSLAKYSYILSIDADEEISTELQQSIIVIKPELNRAGYYFNRRTNYCGKWIYHCGWYPDAKVRLFRKEHAKWVGKIHEKLEIAHKNNQFLAGDLLHYSYPSIQRHIEKINLFSETAAAHLFENNKKIPVLKLILLPVFTFFRFFLLKKGFLDGYHGFLISVMSSYGKFYKYAKLKEYWINHAKNIK